MTEIKTFVRIVYGEPRRYVLDPEQAKHLERLTGTKTITSRHMLALQALGLSFSEVLDPKHADLTPWTR